MSELLNDVRHSIRVIRRAPAFALSAITLLAIGVALSTIVFAMVRGYLLQPLPYPDAARVVQLIPDASRTFANVPRGLEGIDVDALTGVFTETAKWDLDGFTVLGGEQPRFVDGAWVNRGFFSIVGARPLLGRLLSDSDVRDGARVAVISHAFWQSHFGGRADILNQPLRAYSTDRPLSGDLFTVVGVLPPDFWHVNTFTDILTPLTTPRFATLARLAPGVTIADATDRLNAAARAAIPDAPATWTMGLATVQDEYAREIRPTLLVLFAAVASVLLVACANVAGLLMVRGLSRQREFAIRAAIGAGKGRLVRQQLIENLVLATAAAALSLWLTLVGVDVVAAWMETQLGLDIPGGARTIQLDWQLALFAGATALTAGLLIGLRPAFGALLAGTERLASATRGGVAGHGRFRAAMVVSQVALSFLLIAGAGLMVQTLLAVQRVDLGFDPGSVLKGHVLLPQARYPDGAARSGAVRQMLGEVGALPGVVHAATVMPHPFRFQGRQPLRVEGAEGSSFDAVHHVVAGDYWKTMGIPLIEGRVFDDRDRAGTELVTVISRDLARLISPERSALGRRLRTSAADNAPWRTVVGVVGDVRKTFNQPLVGDTYVPYHQSPGGYLALLVRSAGDPEGLTQPIQRRLAGVAPVLPMHEVEPMARVVARQARQQRFLATLLTWFAALTVAIAAVGLYTVLAFTVATRRREIAVRVAVGASRRQIAVAVLREGAILVGAGLVIGIGVAMVSAGALSAQLFGVSPLDASTYAAAAALFAAVSLGAISLPALRATKVNAVDALRAE